MFRSHTRSTRRWITLLSTIGLLSLGGLARASITTDFPAGYDKVTKNIYTRHSELPTTASQPGFKLNSPTIVNRGGVDMVRMSYSFNYNDAQFGIQGHMALLSSQHVGRQESGLYKVKNEWLDPNHTESGTVAVGGTGPSKLNATNTPWLSVHNQGTRGELYDYLTDPARSGQWNLDTDPLSNNVNNPWRRTAAALGMAYDTTGQNSDGGYANNYIATFWVDAAAVFRPSLYQSLLGDDAGSHIIPNPLKPGTFMVDPVWHQPWLHEHNLWGPRPDTRWGGRFGDPSNLHQYEHFSDFYRAWWSNNTAQWETGGFPWTGNGYTYDWYYQDPTEWSTRESGHFRGQGVSEFVLMPSISEAVTWSIEVESVQTTYQFLGGQNGDGFQTPEPTSLTIFGMACLAGLGFHRRRC
ncbi:MAG: PEP-CTERM sorting domain-containing protein [Mariniblastus sp.]|nr:PEP-CTERM sorting domain-containing protein [Mariniblastus sp.]